MLHSKIYFFEMSDGTATAFVGSHNLAGFALRGLNGEAGVLLAAKHPENWLQIVESCARIGKVGHPASVSVANADDAFDPTGAVPACRYGAGTRCWHRSMDSLQGRLAEEDRLISYYV